LDIDWARADTIFAAATGVPTAVPLRNLAATAR